MQFVRNKVKDVNMRSVKNLKIYKLLSLSYSLFSCIPLDLQSPVPQCLIISYVWFYVYNANNFTKNIYR